MKRLQGNTIAKLCAWAVLLVAAFGTGIFGVRAVLSFGSVADNSWQDSSRYYNAVDNAGGSWWRGSGCPSGWSSWSGR